MAIGYELPTNFSDTVKARFWIPESISVTRRTNSVEVTWLGYVNKDAYVKGNPYIASEMMNHTIGEVFTGAFITELVSSLQNAALTKLGWDTATEETENAYYITYYGNGDTSGTPPIDDNWYEQGDTVTLLGQNDLIHEDGYIFNGWNTQADGLGQSGIESQTFQMPASDLILYAQWIES